MFSIQDSSLKDENFLCFTSESMSNNRLDASLGLLKETVPAMIQKIEYIQNVQNSQFHTSENIFTQSDLANHRIALDVMLNELFLLEVFICIVNF